MPGYGVCPSCWNGAYMPAEGGMVPRPPLGGRVPRPPLGGRVPRPAVDGGNNPICKAPSWQQKVVGPDQYWKLKIVGSPGQH